jgi:ribosomal-protein-serine acetyltransferase
MKTSFENYSKKAGTSIEIRARTDNEKSRAIPIRLGFKEEGILRQVDYNNDHYYDHVVYGLLKNEWKEFLRTST